MDESQTEAVQIYLKNSKETSLSFPTFNIPFGVHTDTIKYQLGEVIPQEKKPVAFFL